MKSPVSYIRLSLLVLRAVKTQAKSCIERITEEVIKKDVFIKISKTKPIKSNVKSEIEIVSVTSHNDFYMLVLGLKSLFFHSGYKFGVRVFDDGSLRLKDIDFLKSHIVGIKVVRKEEYDERLNKYSKAFFGNKEVKDNPAVIKKLGPILFSKKIKLLFLDSDVLFFANPTFLIDWIHGKKDIIYLKDYQNAYSISNIESRKLFGVRLAPMANTGLVGIYKHDLILTDLHKIIEFYATDGRFRLQHFQAYFAVLFSKLKSRRKIFVLPQSYLVGNPNIPINYSQHACIHFVGLVREKYYDAARIVLDKLT